nr:MAG TPA: hypothetical protein [Caudoviricetes sp.]
MKAIHNSQVGCRLIGFPQFGQVIVPEEEVQSETSSDTEIPNMSAISHNLL